MSEHIPVNHERRERHAPIPTPERQEHGPKPEHHPERSEQARHEHIKELEKRAEKHATSRKELTVSEAESVVQPQPYLANAELKAEAFQRALKRVQRHLSPPERTFSKAIHQPVIDALSKVGEKTIARPNGVLAGAICALAGSTYVLYMAKRYGFEYNYGIILILFVGGYLLGLLVELLVYSLRRFRHK